MPDDPKIKINGRNIGFCSTFFIVLFLLKVGVVKTVVMGWSWWIITSPLWVGIAFVLAILILCGSLIVFAYLWDMVPKYITFRKNNRKTKTMKDKK